MKQIKRSKTKTTLSVKLALFFVFLILVVSSLFSVKYAKEKNIEYAVLTESKKIASPQSSSSAGFYKESLVLKLNTSEKGSLIYYTLDGTEPSLKSEIYSKPIVLSNRSSAPDKLAIIPTSPRWKQPIESVFKGTVLRAIAVLDGKKSKELVQTFFIDEQNSAHYHLPTIELTVNEEDVFGYENGIYVLGKNYEDKDYYIRKKVSLDMPWWYYPSNYLKRGINSERPVHIEYFETTGRLGFSIDAGLRINGNATRGYAQKSLRICFRDKYGMGALNYNLFPKSKTRVFNSIILRNSGNDWDKTMFRDAFMQSLMQDSKLDIQQYQPSIVFINGEYWGLHNIRERSDENYISNKYGIDKDSLTILELRGSLFYGKKSDPDGFSNLLKFISTNDLSKEENYRYVEKQIDLENFMDFIIANVYFCNSDWPNNNVKYWRYKAEIAGLDSVGKRDGRWRWMLFDTDWGFGYTGKESYTMNLFEKATKTSSIGVIFGGLLQNKTFLNKFSERFNHHLETTFKTETVLERINEFQEVLKPEMKEHIDRWRVIGSYSQWEEYVEELRAFAKQRPAIQKQQLNEFIQKYK